MTTKEEIISMKKDIQSINEKIDNLDGKLDMLTDRLLNPDKGVAARVNRNTSMRKVLVKAMWVIYTITLGALIKIFTE
jgi:peptidoglycan hydrolase CwlO-like protein